MVWRMRAIGFIHETQGLQAFAPIYDRVVIGDLRAEEGIIITP